MAAAHRVVAMDSNRIDNPQCSAGAGCADAPYAGEKPDVQGRSTQEPAQKGRLIGRLSLAVQRGEEP